MKSAASLAHARTETGEEVFENAVKAGVIRVMDIEEKPEVFTHFVEMTVLKKNLAVKEIERRKSAGKPVPPSFARLLELLPREVSLLSALTAEQIMTKEVMTVPPESTVEELLALMTKHHHMGYPVVDKKEGLVGIVTFDDIAKVPASERSKVSVDEIARKNS